MMRGGSLESKWSADVTASQTTADGSIRFKMNDFNVLGKRLRDITLNLNGQATADATNILTNITRLTLLYGSNKGWDAPLTFFRALLGFITKRAQLATAADYLNIPLHLFRGYSAPPGQNLDLMLTKNATFGTNQVPIVKMNLGFNQRDETRGFTYILAKLYGVPANAPAGFNLKPDQPGKLQYLILPTLTGVVGLSYSDPRGQRNRFTDVKTLIAQQEQYSGVAYAAPYSGPFVYKFPEEVEVKSGVTEILLHTTGWTDDEIALVTEFPNPKLAAARKRGA